MKITLCGSTKFKKEYEEWNKKLTLWGHVVYSVACFGHQENIPFTKKQKELLDLVHLKKIMESDVIVVISVDNHIGSSTNREIIWALLLGKKVFYIEGRMKDLENEFFN